MEQQDKKEHGSFLPVLPRLDRLDRLMQLLEEKHSLSGRTYTPKQPEVKSSEAAAQVVHFKPLSNALEEVHHKGTLMERLEFLEKRLLQLSIDIDEGNTSRSSSSTIPVSEKLGHSSCLSSVTKEAPEEEGSRDEISATESESRSKKRKQKRKGNGKWRGWFALGCT